MSTHDTCCSIVPYFKVNDGKMKDFKLICEEFVARTKTEKQCLYYGFSFLGDIAHCREAYTDAQALLTHIDNVGDLIAKALEISELTRLEIHGPEQELNKLRAPLNELNADFYALEYGFRN